MTIIKHTRKINCVYFICVLSALLVAGGVLYVSSYTALVETKHKARNLPAEIERLKTEIADQQGEIFQVTETRVLREFAESRGLIAESEPQYLYIRP